MKKELDKAINLHRKGLLEKAEKIYLEILNIDKKNSYVLQLIGTLYLQKKNFNLSEKYLLHSLEQDPKNPGTLNNLGILKKNAKDFVKSLEYFELNIEKIIF